MNPYLRAVRSLIRLIALGIIIVGALLGILEVIGQRNKGLETDRLKIFGYALLLLAGIVLFGVAGKLTARLIEDDGPDDDTDHPDNCSD